MKGRIPQPFIDDLIARTDIVGLIDKRVQLTRRGREYVACCPFHHEKTPSFTVSPEKQFYHCFGCGAHGTALGFLMEYERLDFVEAVELLAQELGLEVPREAGAGATTPAAEYQPLYDAMAAAAEFYRRQLRTHSAAIDHHKRLGVTGEIARAFGLCHARARIVALLRDSGTWFPQSTLQATRLLCLNPTVYSHYTITVRTTFHIHDARR